MRVDGWRLMPFSVFGGYAVRWTCWVRERDGGWGEEWEHSTDPTVYPNADEAEAACKRLLAAAL